MTRKRKGYRSHKDLLRVPRRIYACPSSTQLIRDRRLSFKEAYRRSSNEEIEYVVEMILHRIWDKAYLNRSRLPAARKKQLGKLHTTLSDKLSKNRYHYKFLTGGFHKSTIKRAFPFNAVMKLIKLIGA